LAGDVAITSRNFYNQLKIKNIFKASEFARRNGILEAYDDLTSKASFFSPARTKSTWLLEIVRQKYN
jgi:hypothetical protein